MKKCMIVDDEERNRYLLEVLLQGNGYETETAKNGAEALDKARTNPPDIIITDILMPVMDGFALCKEWKNDERLRAIPLIIYTATYTEPKDEAFALSLGADRFLIKPQEPAVIMAELEKIFKKASNGSFAVTCQTIPEDDFMKRHYETVISKLEDKMEDLQHLNALFTLEIEEKEKAQAALLENQKVLEAAYMELKQAQAQVIQQEKMASIGQLAAGITHEINNPMSFITGNLGILKSYLENITEIITTEDEIARKHAPPETLEALLSMKKEKKVDYILKDIVTLINQSLEGADRVKKIVTDLKTFSRMEEKVYMIEDINEALESTINIVWNEIKYKAELVKELGKLPLTSCNISHLNQVFMNLLVNAAQAIEKEGKITVKTWRGGNAICISVSDTGSGITEENLTRIFDPFFTTKEKGKGTGLGLSISYDIVKRHNGEITVESKVGEGTTFIVKIPIIE